MNQEAPLCVRKGNGDDEVDGLDAGGERGTVVISV